jgi:hypothetical protein
MTAWSDMAAVVLVIFWNIFEQGSGVMTGGLHLRFLIYSRIFFYSCCPHLEHRASVKRFISLQFLNLRQSVGLLGWGISPSQGRNLSQTQNKYKQTSMPCVGFEPTISMFEQAKTFHALDHATTVTGLLMDILE